MADKEKILTFKSFAEKAVKRMEERKKIKVKRYYIGDLDEEIVLRGLSLLCFKNFAGACGVYG